MKREKSLGDIWRESPEEALEEAYRRNNKRHHPFYQDVIPLWVSFTSANGTGYGSYRHVRKEELVDREYDIEFWDGMVSIRFTDVIFNPRGRKLVWKKK